MSTIAEGCVKAGIVDFFDVPKDWKPLVIQDQIINDDDWIKVIKKIVRCMENKCPILVEGDILDLRNDGKKFQDVIDKIDSICPKLTAL